MGGYLPFAETLSLIKSALDITKGLKDLNDTTRRNAAVIELQEKLLAAREAQSATLDYISELEKEVASFETWDTESKRYELKELVRGHPTLAYALKPDAQPPETFHCICATCYQKRIKSILQLHRAIPRSDEKVLICPVCETKVHYVGGWPPKFA